MSTVNEDIYFLSNCNRRQHARMYGPGAFYDLDVEGHQAKLAKDISKGQKCVVATPKNRSKNQNRDIAFEWFVLARIAIKRDVERDVLCRGVLLGSYAGRNAKQGKTRRAIRFIKSSSIRTETLSTAILSFGQNDLRPKADVRLK